MTRPCPPLDTGSRPGSAARRPASWLERLRGDTTGGMVLEYALVAPAFIALMLGILHVALIYFAQEGLETAIEGAARIIMTGQAQTLTVKGKTLPGMGASDFKTAICSGMTLTASDGKTPVPIAKSLPPFLACDRLAVNVQVVPSGCASPTITTPIYAYDKNTGAITSTGSGFGNVSCNGTGNDNAGLKGTQGDLVILQLTYLWPTTGMPMGFNLVNQPNGNRLLLATYVFTVESYLCADGTTSTC